MNQVLPTAIECGSPYVTDESIQSVVSGIDQHVYYLCTKGGGADMADLFLREVGLLNLRPELIEARVREEYGRTCFLSTPALYQGAHQLVAAVRQDFSPENTWVYMPPREGSESFIPRGLPEYQKVFLINEGLFTYDNPGARYSPVSGVANILFLDDWALTGSKMEDIEERLRPYCDHVWHKYVVMTARAVAVAKSMGINASHIWSTPEQSETGLLDKPLSKPYVNIYGAHKLPDTLHPVLERSGWGHQYTIFRDSQGNPLYRHERVIALGTTP